ncbi:hypothetical protein [Rhodococcus zopfii]|uniref:hypothetical protein n=1 Tax=Rhodococcus zopfii TaxID=43772 RepID=UPI0009335C92|nr:hypothetical protein [Rhodococcus zopfii]
MSSLQDEDAREWRRRQREENRAAARGDVPLPPTDATPAERWPVPAVAAGPAPARPQRPAGPQLSTRVANTFRIVDTLPSAENRSGRPIPEHRRDLIEFAKANAGRWIEYPPAGDDAYKSVSTFVSTVRSGKGGFAPKGAFEATARNKIAYVRYIGTDGGDQ